MRVFRFLTMVGCVALAFGGGIAVDRIIAATEPEKAGPSAPLPQLADYLAGIKQCECDHTPKMPENTGPRQAVRPEAQ